MTGFSEARISWEANSAWPPQNHHTRGLEEYARLVYERTGGELELLVSAGGINGLDGSDPLRAVRDGQVIVSDMLISRYAGEEPLFDIVTIPFLVRGVEEGRKLNDLIRPIFNTITTERWNQQILYTAPWPAAGLWTRNPITSLDDLKGLQTRTYDRNGARFMEALGATGCLLSVDEMLPALAEGRIDSVLTSTPTAVENRFWKVLPYFLRIDVTLAINMVTVNLEAYHQLDPAIQQVLIETGREMEAYLWDQVAQLDRDQERIANEQGVESLPVPAGMRDELYRLTEVIRREWLENAPAEICEVYHKYFSYKAFNPLLPFYSQPPESMVVKTCGPRIKSGVTDLTTPALFWIAIQEWSDAVTENSSI